MTALPQAGPPSAAGGIPPPPAAPSTPLARATLVRATAAALVAVLAALAAVVCAASPANAAGETNIDHVEVAADGTVEVLVAVDGVEESATIDLERVTVALDGAPVEASAKFVEDGDMDRTTVLALDTSLSMNRGNRFDAARDAALAYLDNAPEDVRIGLLTYDGSVRIISAPTTDRDALRVAIEGLALSRGTRLFEGISEAVGLAGDDGARSVLVLSDGRNVGGDVTLDDAVDTAIANGVIVDVVTLDSNRRGLDALTRIATASGGMVVEAGADDLPTVFSERADALRRALVVSFEKPPGMGSEAMLEVWVRAGEDAWVDRAYVSLGAPAAGRLVSADTGRGAVGGWALYLGIAAIAGGLALALGVVLVNGSRRPNLAQRQVAWFSGEAPRAAAHRAAGLRQWATRIARQAMPRNLDERITLRLAGAGSAVTASEWLLVHAGIALAAAIVGVALSGVALAGLLFVIGAILPWLWLRWRHARRLAAFSTQLPATLDLLAGGLSAGLSLPQAVDTVVREAGEPVASELRRALVEQRLGVEISDALEGVANRMDSEDFGWVVMAIRIQREVGGNLSQLLGTVAATIREREYVRQQVRVLSAEGRLSAWVLGLMPVVMFGYMVVVRPDTVRPLLTTGYGVVLLAVAVLLLALGAFWLSRLTRVEV